MSEYTHVNGFYIKSFYEGLDAYVAYENLESDSFFKCYSLDQLAKHIGVSPEYLRDLDF